MVKRLQAEFQAAGSRSHVGKPLIHVPSARSKPSHDLSSKSAASPWWQNSLFGSKTGPQAQAGDMFPDDREEDYMSDRTLSTYTSNNFVSSSFGWSLSQVTNTAVVSAIANKCWCDDALYALCHMSSHPEPLFNDKIHCFHCRHGRSKLMSS
jgi:hypothetical protein